MHPSSSDDAPNAPEIEMPRYKSHKRVWALKIASIGHPSGDDTGDLVVKLSFQDEGYAPIHVPIKVFSRYTPVPGDYYVVYDDGYKSISPARAFEDGYTRTEL